MERVRSIHGVIDNSISASSIKLLLHDWTYLKHTWLLNVEDSDFSSDLYWSKTQLATLSKSPFVHVWKDDLPFPKRLLIKFPTKEELAYFSAGMFGKGNSKVDIPAAIFYEGFL